MGRQPRFLFVKHRNRVLDVFVYGLVGAALDILPNQRLKFRSKSYFHSDILPCATRRYIPSSILLWPATSSCGGVPREGTCGGWSIVRHTNMRISFASALIFCLLAGLLIPLAAQEQSDAAAVRSLELKWTESYKQRKVDILAS